MLDRLIRIAPLVSASAIVTSAFVALCVFIYTRRANRRRATLDMVMRSFLDERGTKLYDEFKILVRKDQNTSDTFSLIDLVEHTAKNETDRNVVIDQLNIYELVALGIRRGVFDEKFYKLWFHRQFTRDFGHVSELIMQIQKKRPSTYCEFRALNDRWMRNRHPINHPNRGKLAWWALTGNFKSLDAARTGMNT